MSRKRMIKTIFLVCLIATVLISQLASAYSIIPIEYWYSNDSKVGHWTSIPEITKIKFNDNSSFYFNFGYANARSQWASAGIQTTDNGSSPSCVIVCFGGTASELIALGFVTSGTLNGVNGYTRITDNNLSLDAYLGYNNTQKILYELVPTIPVFIVDNGSSLSQTSNTFIHEVGHALGWLGHSTQSSDIMYSYGTEITTLSTRDRLHLSRFY